MRIEKACVMDIEYCFRRVMPATRIIGPRILGP